MVAGVSREHKKAEFARAVRKLLARPMIDRSDHDFQVVLEHQRELGTWFRKACDWPLLVDGNRGFARLHKVLDLNALHRPLLRTQRTKVRPFDRQRYALLCVTLVALGYFPRRQVSLQDLSSRIIDLTDADDVVLTYAPDNKEHRVALVDVLYQLERFGLVATLDRGHGDYESNADANALYTINDHLLTHFVVESDAFAEAGDTPLHGAMRRLLDDPVLYDDELTPEERAFLAQGTQVVRRLLGRAGLLLERRSDGWCVVDPTEESTDLRFPQLNNITHQTSLLLISRLGAGAWKSSGWIPTGRLRHEIGRIMGEHAHWARTYQDADGAERLLGKVLDLLSGLDLIRRDEHGIEFRPAAGRFRNIAISTATYTEPA